MTAEILVADPDPAARAALAEMIGSLATCDLVATGADALEAAKTRAYAAILLDTSLGDGRALDLASRLRSDAGVSRNAPILFMSATPPDWMEERQGYGLGALGYLTKPVDAVALRARLEILLTLFRRGEELRHQEQRIAEQHAEITAARAALAQAAEANRTKDLYMGVLGHDLRSPLGAMLMSARMMLMRPTLDEHDRRSLERMARNGERMAALIRDILDYTRGQSAAGIPINVRHASMNDICSSIVDEISLLYRDRPIRLDARGDLAGVWDRERVEQVISNLLTNALNHGRGEVALTLEGRPAEVVVSVHNGGTPIPPEQIPTLFQPFRRGTSRSGGLGLGLYIVSEIVRAHGGTIEVQSTAALGTKFTSRWPRIAASRPPQGQST